MKKTIVVRVDRCVGCRSCELACAVAHSVAKELTAAVQGGEKPGYRVTVESYEGSPVPIHCHHCEDAPCVMACPTGAVHRESDDGPVLFDGDRCIGCRMCVQACPFGVITMSSGGKGVLKCDLCAERLAEGAEPACVVACATGALEFAEEQEVNREKRRKSAEDLVKAQQESRRDTE